MSVYVRACVYVLLCFLEDGGRSIRKRKRNGKKEKFACMPSSQAKDALEANRGA